MSIDARVLQALLKAAGDKTKYTAGDDGKWTEMWDAAFDRSMRTSGAHGASLQTDGVSLCVHYVFEGAAEPQTLPAQRKKRRIEASKARGTAPTSLDPTRRVLPAHVIAIDPGQKTPLFGMRVTPDGFERHVLTKSAYYVGKRKSDARVKRWLNSEREADSSMLTPKTVSSAAWDAYLSDVHATLATVTANRHAKKWSRNRFRMWSARHRAADGFFNGLKAACGGETPHLAWGDASFNSTYKGGGLPAPSTFLQRRAVATLGAGCMTPVDEFRTSKCCSTCGAVLQVVKAQKKCKNGVIRWCEVRGLRRCDSTECRMFVDRDANAALNILQVFKGMCSLGVADAEHRPPQLRRDNDRGSGLLGSFCLRSGRAPDGSATSIRGGSRLSVMHSVEVGGFPNQ